MGVEQAWGQVPVLVHALVTLSSLNIAFFSALHEHVLTCTCILTCVRSLKVTWPHTWTV